ncbi:MAG: hypothetical protein V3T86_14525 [Planctomycetota bacterium]
MWLLLIPPILAGGLGLLAHGADEGTAYLPRVRLMLLGAAALALIATGVFVWINAQGKKRWAALALVLVSGRICYVSVVATALCTTGWLETLGRTLGVEDLSAAVHYCFAMFTCAFLTLSLLLVLLAATRPLRWYSIAIALTITLLGVHAFAHTEDREVFPHGFSQTAPAPAHEGDDYFAAVRNTDLPVSSRFAALGGGIRHAVMPRGGWAGSVRREMLARFRSSPNAGLRTRVQAFEAALLRSRPLLQTSSRSPRGS